MPCPALRPVLLAALLWAVASPVWAEDGGTRLDASTEAPLSGAIRPPPPLARVVLDAIGADDRRDLDRCLAEEEPPGSDPASLLLAARVRAGARRNLWFVRPALVPYCSALYGAHAFRYFLVEERIQAHRSRYRLLFQDGGDAFAILGRTSYGLNDVEATGCTAVSCRGMRLSFDGRTYRPVRCTDTRWNAARQKVVERRPCGSDDGRDDQASGPERPPVR